MRVLGAPARMVDASEVSRLQAGPLGVDIVADAYVPVCVRHGVRTYDPGSDWLFNGWKGGVRPQWDRL